jgi:hypothetical protein
MSKRRDIKVAKRIRRESAEDVNPMHYISNLVDAMLVLAVGIMLALVINWNIDMTSAAEKEKASEAESSKIPTFNNDNLESVNESDIKNKDKLEQSGTVYYDPETDTYYLMKE